jgi:hypothetical protein
VIVFECVNPPVVEKALDNNAYAVPDEVEYLQVADSLVERDMVAWVVPAARVPDGRPLLLAGGVVSVIAVAEVFPETILDKGEMLFASSIDLIAK